MVAWLDSYQVGIGQVGIGQVGTLEVEDGGRLLVEGQQDMRGCIQEGRLGLVVLLEGEDLIHTHMHRYPPYSSKIHIIKQA